MSTRRVLSKVEMSAIYSAIDAGSWVDGVVATFLCFGVDLLAPEVCKFCGETITLVVGGTWVDATDGDCCSGGDNLTNENGVHQPVRIRPADYAIPEDQWGQIATWCGMHDDKSDLNRVNHMLDWMNKGPSGYQDGGS